MASFEPVDHPVLPRDLLADDILRFTTLFANLYIVGSRDNLVLVDAGLPGFARQIRRAVERRFGSAARPTAIILTHGHWDHAGSALDLAKEWDVPVYAHPLELPFLTGKSRYAPKDPTVGGMIGFAARVMPSKGYDFGARVRPLPADGSVPAMPGWQWIHTPGHTHGHVSLFRERDRILLAGDALATVNQDSPYTAITRKPEFYRPPAPFTVDWAAADSSIQTLAALLPSAVGAGHGWPIKGAQTPDLLKQFSSSFKRPTRGRYAKEPAVADENGIVSVPPPVPDYTGRLLAIWAVAGVAGVAAAVVYQQVKKRRDQSAAEQAENSPTPSSAGPRTWGEVVRLIPNQTVTIASVAEFRSRRRDSPAHGWPSSPDRQGTL